jgi:hypothetical protein
VIGDYVRMMKKRSFFFLPGRMTSEFGFAVGFG